MIERRMNMLNNCEIKILDILIKHPLEFYSINNIAKKINLAYPYVYESVQTLEKKRLVSINKIGKSNLCSIKFSSPEELAIASSISTREFLSKHLSVNNLTLQLKDALSDELYILFLFGSHAKGNADKTSDIDLFFVIKNKRDIDKFRNKVNSVISRLNYNVEFEVSTIGWFYDMLGDKTTVGSEIFKSNIVLHNTQAYFYLIKKYSEKKGIV